MAREDDELQQPMIDRTVSYLRRCADRGAANRDKQVTCAAVDLAVAADTVAAEVERLRADLAAYAHLAGGLEARLDTALAVVERVAASADGRMLMCMCGIVGTSMRQDTPTWIMDGGPVVHQPDCVFAQARALLASAGERSGGDGA